MLDKIFKSSGKNTDNNKLHLQQIRLFLTFLFIIVLVVIAVTLYVQKKISKIEPIKSEVALKFELADKAIDPDIMWRNYHEEELAERSEMLQKRIDLVEERQGVAKEELLEKMRSQVELLAKDLQEAKGELYDASRRLQEIAAKEEERLSLESRRVDLAMDVEDFSSEIEFDVPKPINQYVPEGTYFTGYLLGGIVVSTALSSADENATPVTIQLKYRGNLAKENEVDISKCRIMGSAYGDLSSERAIIRLEKMICREDDMYVTSYIAGDVHGPDGFNGVKGRVVQTSSKHIKNAMIGGLISGFANSSQGLEGVNLSSGGIVSTKNKDFKDMMLGGVSSGVSNAGEKIADYYLRQAEAMSPILTIPGGVRVNAHITKGFYVGEISTHRKIKSARAGRLREVEDSTGYEEWR